MPEQINASSAFLEKLLRARVYILDSFDSYADFIAAHPTGEEGDAYAVGGDLYIWGVSRQSWLYVGPLTAPDFAALSEVEAMLDDVYGAGSGSSGGGGGSAGDGSVATDSEADEMLDDVFGSASGGSAVDDSVVTTDEEAQEMLDDVFEG